MGQMRTGVRFERWQSVSLRSYNEHPSMRRVLILMSKTGGGHVAAARALKEAFESKYGAEFEIDIVDVLVDYMAYPINRLPSAYDLVVERAPKLWHMLWRSMAEPKISRTATRIATISARKRIEKLLNIKRPDLVLSVHPLVNHLVIPILAKMYPSSLYATVITDLESIHPLWLHSGAAATFVPSDKTARLVASHGIDQTTIYPFGLPLRQQFTEFKRSQAELRCTFGLNPTAPTIIIIGGGGGVGGVASLVKQVGKALSQVRDERGNAAQLVVICGRNNRLRRILSNKDWPITVRVFGFVERIADLMCASDLIVTKAGPGTIAEATSCGLPIIISSFIPGQEEGNVRFVLDNSAGLYVPDKKEIGSVIARLLGPERATLGAMAKHSSRIAKPAAAVEIVETLSQLLEENQRRHAA